MKIKNAPPRNKKDRETQLAFWENYVESELTFIDFLSGIIAKHHMKYQKLPEEPEGDTFLPPEEERW